MYLSNQVEAEHGYGGLSSILPYDYDSYMPTEYQLAQQYSGLEVDSIPFISSLELLDHIKGVNWFTILGAAFVERLGGEETIQKRLLGRGDVTIQHYNHGIIIRAGELPDLGEKEIGMPAPYVAVNSVVKPVRIPNPDQLHSYSPYGDCFDEESTKQWYARFDQPESKTQPARIAGGDPCSHSGYWFTPAKEYSRQYFQRGEIMPIFEDSNWGATFWYWADGDLAIR